MNTNMTPHPQCPRCNHQRYMDDLKQSRLWYFLTNKYAPRWSGRTDAEINAK